MYAVYECLEYIQSIMVIVPTLDTSMELPDTAAYLRVEVKVPKQFKISIFLYRGTLSRNTSTVILRVAFPGRNMRNNLTLDRTTS